MAFRDDEGLGRKTALGDDAFGTPGGGWRPTLDREQDAWRSTADAAHVPSAEESAPDADVAIDPGVSSVQVLSAPVLAAHPAANSLQPLVVTDFTALLDVYTVGFAPAVGPSNPARGAFVSFSFMTAPAPTSIFAVAAAGAGTFLAFTEAEKALAREALAKWGDICGVRFFEVPPGELADINFARYDLPTAQNMNAAGIFNGGGSFENWQSFILIDDNVGNLWADLGRILLHEVGHALGLKHPHEGDIRLDPAIDDLAHTVMSYVPVGWTGGLGPLDVQAAQFMYGDAASDGSQISAWSWSAATNTLTQTGNEASELIRGMNAATDVINGGGGDDQIAGYSGNDSLAGGDGADKLYGGRGLDSLYGGNDNDFIDGGDDSDAIYAGAGNDLVFGSGGDDLIYGDDGDDSVISGDGNDTILGGEGNDFIAGGIGSDILIGELGNDILNGGGHDASAPDYFFGGAGNDTYYVNSAMTGAQDLVDEGEGNPALAGLSTDLDTIISQGALFWDFYSVGENLQIDRDEGGQIVGGKNVAFKNIIGGTGNDIILSYGRSSVVDGGVGTDAISFELYGLGAGYEGSNTLIMKPGNGLDYLYGFESGVDKIDLSQFGYGLSGAQWKSFLVDVENGDNDYCFLYLGQPGQYLVFVGMTSSEIAAWDFIG